MKTYSLELKGTNLVVTVTEDSSENIIPFSIIAHQIELSKSANALILQKANKVLTIPIAQIGTYNTYAALKVQLLLWIQTATIQVDNVELNNVTIDGSTLAKDASLISILAQLVTNQNIGGKTESLNAKVAPVVSAGAAYAAGNAIGAKLQFENILGAKKTGVLHSLLITDRTNVARLPMEVLIFNADLTGAVVNRTAYTFDNADVPKLIRRISIAASDYINVGGVAIVDIRGIGGVLKSTNQDLWVVCVATGAGSGNFTNTTDFNIRLGVLQD